MHKVHTKETVFEVVKNNILDILPLVKPELISTNISLTELGANSIDRMEVLTLSMEDLNIKVPLLNFAKVANIDDLVNILFKYTQ